MKITSIFFISLHLFFIGINSLNAQSVENRALTKTKIDKYLSQGVNNGFSGAILVSEKGKIVLNEGYGMANKKMRIANTSKTVFDIGSNTKQFTGAAILKLTELRKLKVTDSLYKFFKNIPADKKNITVHQLLTHSAGFKESIGRDFDHITRDEFFKKVFASELIHKPGANYSYSNIGYSVLARIIELASHNDYEVFLDEFLFKPSGMMQTGYLLPEWNINQLARGYNRNIIDAGPTVTRYQEDEKISWHLKGNGGINSTQEDLYKWYKSLKKNKVLSQSLFEKYTTSYIGDPIESFGYAYGWGITFSDRHTKRITHNGSNGPFSHTIIWLPEEDVIIIYATNTGSPKVERLAYNVEKIIFDKNYELKPIKKNPYFLVLDFVEQNDFSKSSELFSLIKEDVDFNNSDVLNRTGYMVLKTQKLDWAIRLFEINTKLFPAEGNVWDSLGDGYLANGQKEKAIKSFKKAIELNSEGTAEKLKELLKGK